MYGACALPRISPRLWFSMTIVNTVPPCHAGATTAGPFVNGSHATFVLPELLAQPASDSAPRRIVSQDDRMRFVMRDNLVLDIPPRVPPEDRYDPAALQGVRSRRADPGGGHVAFRVGDPPGRPALYAH